MLRDGRNKARTHPVFHEKRLDAKTRPVKKGSPIKKKLSLSSHCTGGSGGHDR